MLKVNSTNISTYQDLLNAKRSIKEEVSLIEEDLSNNNFVKITSSIFEGENIKGSIFDSFNMLNLRTITSSPLGSLIGHVVGNIFLSNKTLRKYFIIFTVVKDSIFALNEYKNKDKSID